LAGVFPIMISMKQRSFYILTVFPFAGISIAMYFTPSIIIIHNWFSKYVFKRTVLFLMIALSVIGIIVSSTFVGRDKQMLSDVYSIGRLVNVDETLCLSKGARPDWSLIAYLSRYNKISVKVKGDDCTNLLILKSENSAHSNEKGKWVMLKSFDLLLNYSSTNPQ